MKTTDTEIPNEQNLFRFENLRVYNKAIEHSVFVKQVLSSSESVDAELIGKIIEASVAIPICIASGCLKSKTEFIKGLKRAKYTLVESVVHVTIAANLSYISSDVETELRNQLIELVKMIGALINSLRRNNNNNNENSCE